MTRSAITRAIDTPDGPYRRYYSTRAEQLERLRRDRVQNLARARRGRGGSAAA